MTITRLLVQVQPIVALPHRSRNPRAFLKASMVDAIKSHLIKLLRTSSLGVTEPR